MEYSFKSRWNDMTSGYTGFFFKKNMESLISAMGLTARRITTRTHEGKWSLFGEILLIN